MAKAKSATVCPVGRKQFAKHAQPLTVQVGGSSLLAEVHEFSSGSLGWFANGKVTVQVDGKPVRVQVNVTLTAIGSKTLPQE